MKRAIAVAALSFALALEARAGDPLQDFMRHVDAQARADLSRFHATVAAQFGVPEVQVRAVFGRVQDPADVFMIFQVSRMSHQSLDRVLPVYESHKHAGWGAMAKELGIKPGSPEFHALKSGDLQYGPGGVGHGKGKGKGHGNGKGGGSDQ